MTKYAYLSNKGIMHVIEDRGTAEKYKGRGRIVETAIEAKHGYPVVGGEQIIVYGPEEMRYEANGAVIKAIPELATLYNECAE